jgi:hypothetical protein
MLTQAEVDYMERWIVVARNWGESSHGLVALSTDLSTVSRELADRLEQGSGPPSRESKRDDLTRQLRTLADVIEEQVRTLRDDYLATAASLNELGSTI